MKTKNERYQEDGMTRETRKFNRRVAKEFPILKQVDETKQSVVIHTLRLIEFLFSELSKIDKKAYKAFFDSVSKYAPQ